MKKWNNIKQKEILSKRVSADNSTTEKLGIERKELQEMSKNKNLQTIADNRQYRKKKIYSDVFKSVISSTEEAPESVKTVC